MCRRPIQLPSDTNLLDYSWQFLPGLCSERWRPWVLFEITNRGVSRPFGVTPIFTLKILTPASALPHDETIMKSHSLTRKFLIGLLLTGLAATASAQMTINGAGATFPYPIYSKWFDAYAKVDPSVRFNCQSIGPGAGKSRFSRKPSISARRMSPMSDDNLAKAPGKLLHIPTVAGAVVMTYNLSGSVDLKLDGEAIADIFLGKITKWNDPRIAAMNPEIACQITILWWSIVQMAAARRLYSLIT